MIPEVTHAVVLAMYTRLTFHFLLIKHSLNALVMLTKRINQWPVVKCRECKQPLYEESSFISNFLPFIKSNARNMYYDKCPNTRKPMEKYTKLCIQ